MHLSTAHIMALIALPIAVSSVDPNPYKTSAGALPMNYPGGLDFYSNCWFLEGCNWEPAKNLANKLIPGAEQCTCNTNPDNWDDLIWFYTKSSFTGNLMKGFGHYGECQDLPSAWKGKTESVQLNSDTICCLFTQPGCAKTGHWEVRDSTIQGQTEIAQFQGWFQKGVRSWKCSGKKNAGSNCEDTKS